MIRTNDVANITAVFKERPTQNKTTLSIQIDWDDFESVQPENPLKTTSVGLRLTDVDTNAVLVRAITKEVGIDQNIITLEVSPTQKADLFIVAVHEEEGYNSQRALYLGAIHDLVIENGVEHYVTLNDFDLVTAEWRVNDTHSEDYLADSLIGDKNEQYFRLPIQVRDPYEIEPLLMWSSTIFGINGSSWQLDNPDGWRIFHIAASNNKLGETHSTNASFWPYLDGPSFNLSENRYYIGEQGRFIVHWQ